MRDEVIFIIHKFVQFCESATLNLADSLASEAKLFGNLSEGHGFLTVEAVVKGQDMRFPWVDFVEKLEDFFLLFASDHFVFGHLSLLVTEAFLEQLRFVGGVGTCGISDGA